MKRWWLLILLLTSFFAGAQEEAWEAVEEEPRVTVFTRLLPGNKYKSFKAVGVVRAELGKLQKILDDVDAYVDWFAYCRTARLLHTVDTDKFIYMETDFPWPYRNEDMIYRVSISQGGEGAIQYLLTGKPHYLPASKGAHRMVASNGYILLKPDNGHTEVTYVMHTELGGRIPPALANRNIHALPMQTLKNLMKFAETE